MPYKVIPFKANIVAGEGAANAASQLEQMVNQQATQGWAFHSLETLETNVTTPGQPGTSGCIGIGAPLPLLQSARAHRTTSRYLIRTEPPCSPICSWRRSDYTGLPPERCRAVGPAFMLSPAHVTSSRLPWPRASGTP